MQAQMYPHVSADLVCDMPQDDLKAILRQRKEEELADARAKFQALQRERKYAAKYRKVCRLAPAADQHSVLDACALDVLSA
jgi:hypothetical protein